MASQQPVFCCPLVDELAHTDERLGHKLERFVQWARETLLQPAVTEETWDPDTLIEVVVSPTNSPMNVRNVFFVVGVDGNGDETGKFRQLPDRGARRIDPSMPVEECRMLVCEWCQLFYSIFVYKRRQGQGQQ